MEHRVEAYRRGAVPRRVFGVRGQVPRAQLDRRPRAPDWRVYGYPRRADHGWLHRIPLGAWHGRHQHLWPQHGHGGARPQGGAPGRAQSPHSMGPDLAAPALRSRRLLPRLPLDLSRDLRQGGAVSLLRPCLPHGRCLLRHARDRPYTEGAPFHRLCLDAESHSPGCSVRIPALFDQPSHPRRWVEKRGRAGEIREVGLGHPCHRRVGYPHDRAGWPYFHPKDWAQVAREVRTARGRGRDRRAWGGGGPGC
mmetsp:Transcript_58143/g.160985  ORF Transcript_58143/g.160985 Transcript_58143/m.160985 type:complete len:251 (+) Transcript_58143:759-1511(+)